MKEKSIYSPVLTNKDILDAFKLAEHSFTITCNSLDRIKTYDIVHCYKNFLLLK